MAEIITYPLPSGATFTIPDVGETNWGQNVTNFLVAIPAGTLPTSGTFSLTGDVYFGATYGLISQYLKSHVVNPASAGLVRLAKTDTIDWRNNANSGNLPLAINGSDQLIFNGHILASNDAAPGSDTQLIFNSGGSFAASANMTYDGTTLEAGAYSALPSAILAANSTTQGFLPPRMTTTQQNAISSPATGLVIYNTTLNNYNYYNGSAWVTLSTTPAPNYSIGYLTAEFDTSSTTPVNIGLSTSIAASSSTAAILIQVHTCALTEAAGDPTHMQFDLTRDGGSPLSGVDCYIFALNNTTSNITMPASFSVIDIPGDTASHTYNVVVKSSSGTLIVVNGNNVKGTIIAQEIH